MAIDSNNAIVIASWRQYLHKLLDMTDLSPLCYFFGLKVACSTLGYMLSHHKNIPGILQGDTYLILTYLSLMALTSSLFI